MLKPNQYIEVKWHSQTRQHYINKGYQFTHYKDKFVVKAEDLSKASTAKVQVICDYCGIEYSMSWFHYIEIINKNEHCACYNCRNAKRYSGDLAIRQAALYTKVAMICGKLGYKLISEPKDIRNNTSYIKYLCPIHGEQSARINNIINGKKCPCCCRENHREKYSLSYDTVENRINKLGGILLNKDDYINNRTKNLKVICSECKNIFITSLSRFLSHGGQVCPACTKLESKGERAIRHYLDLHNIDFIQEKTFPGCKDKRPLPFDFYLPKYNICIEFDGEQHYRDRGNFSTSLKYTKYHDKLKTEYCNQNNINLLRIPYWQYNNIDKILTKKLISHKDIV